MSYTLEELRDLVDELGFDANTKITLLVGKTVEGKFQIVKVNDDGEIVIAS